jgi:F-type H+-transporting ATPase subunit b
MEDLVKIFHIDWKLLIAQAVNFSVVLGVLCFFATKPLMEIMKTREKKISDGIANADKVTRKLQEAEDEKKAKITEGRKEAQKIVGQAEKDAEGVKQSKVDDTKAEVKKLVEEARRQINSERENMVNGVKDELGQLIMLAVGKVTKDGISPKAQEKLIDEAIAEIKRS